MLKLLTAYIAKLFTKKVLDKNKGEIVKISRPVLKPYDKDRFELVADYEICLKDCEFYMQVTRGLKLRSRPLIPAPNPPSRFQGADIADKSASADYAKITIPKGYKTNGADIPRMFWPLFAPNSPEYLSAVVVHDYLCDEAENIYKLGFKPKARDKFKFADEILQEMMSALGCNRLKTNIFYYACRVWHKLRYGG